MRKINIIYAGGLKAGEGYYRGFIDEYLKRLGRDFTITNIEIKESDPKTEGKKIIEKLGAGAFKIALCVEGKRLPSEGFAALLYRDTPVDFIIGGSRGLSDEAKQSADYLLSLSDMTFNHRLARIMLLEQIYRAYTIQTGKTYHK